MVGEKKTKYSLLVFLILLLMLPLTSAQESTIVTKVKIKGENADINIEITIPDIDEFTDIAEELLYNEYTVREDLENKFGIVENVKVTTDSDRRKIVMSAVAKGVAREISDVWKVNIKSLQMTSNDILVVELPPNVKILKLQPKPSQKVSDNTFMWKGISQVEIIYSKSIITTIKENILLIPLIIVGLFALGIGGKRLKKKTEKYTKKLEGDLDDIERKLEKEK